MKELTIENLHKTYGTKTLLDGIDLSLRTGDRIGLIGPNGTGKSSFLKTIAGLETSDDGKMMAPQNYRIGYLDQNPDLDPDKTVLETIYDSSSPLVRLVHDYEDLRLQLEKDPENVSLQESFLRLSEKMTEQNGWDLETSAKSILTRLGLKNLSQKIGETSGGQQKRAGIAQVLTEAPDLLILDEPTNHLDIASIQWLERYLATY
ncbi:MAG: ATP-binding cassette domain-containing protein [Ruoffia tabacinasalis]